MITKNIWEIEFACKEDFHTHEILVRANSVDAAIAKARQWQKKGKSDCIHKTESWKIKSVALSGSIDIE